VTQPISANRQIARAAGTVMFALIISQIFGLARNIILAATFPAATALDPYLAANRVAETLFLLVAGGALGSAFIPTFTGLLVRDERDPAWRLASGVGNLVTLALTLLALVAALLAPQIVRYVLAPGFADQPGLFATTVELLRIQLISAVIFGVSGLVMGILNAHRVFLVPALAPSMYSIGIIIGALVFAPAMGVRGLAWGVVLGASLHLLVQIPSLLRLKGEYFRTLGWANPSVREVIRLMLPRLLGVAVVQINFWVNIRLASRMPPGSVTALSYAFALMLMAQTVIAQSVATAAMPTFSAQYALNRLDEMRGSLAAALRGVLLLSVPASLGLILLREPLVAVLWQRGAFTARTAEMTAWALLWFAAGLVGHSVLEVLSRAFYAMHDTKTPVLVGAGAMGLNIVFSVAFSLWFARVGWLPLGGLALANSLATALEAALLFALMRRRMDGIHGAEVARGFAQAAAATLGMSLALLWWNQAAAGLGPLGLTLGGILLGGAVYVGAALALQIPEIWFVIDLLRRRLRSA
jgi:putative peptidoglycan lipid II flippase